MSSIEKMLIRGIRSFDPHGTNVIEFFTPLTIIVGPNGSGKTTIIECLKYATTGDLPPNSKGGAFVNDPKIANETEVKAQVKLKFKSMNGQKMVCTRSISLSQKNKTLQQKTLDGVLFYRDVKTGQQVSVTSRAHELDAEMPSHLGVNTAILDSVIFCHQEDSNWPLAEPGTLKKKFDDIFAASQYTKALDKIKTIRKEQTAEIKLSKQRVDFLQNDREKAERLRGHYNVSTEKVETMVHRIAEIETAIIANRKLHADVMERVLQYKLSDSELTSIKQEISMLHETRQELSGNFTVYTELDEELAAMLLEQKNRVLSRDEHIEMFRSRKKEQLDEIDRFRMMISEVDARKGELYGAQKIEDLNLDDAVRFTRKLEDYADKRSIDLEMKRDEFRKKETQIRNNLLSLQGKIKDAEVTSQNAENQIVILSKKLSSLLQNRSGPKLTPESLKELDLKLQENELKIRNMRKEPRLQQLQQMLAEKSIESNEIDSKRETLIKEITNMRRLSGGRVRMEILRNDRAQKNAKLAQMDDEFKSFFPELQTLSNPKDYFLHAEKLLREKEVIMIGHQERKSFLTNDLSSLETTINLKTQEINKKRLTLDENKTSLYEVCGNRSLPEKLKEAEVGLNDRKNQRDEWQGLVRYFQEALTRLDGAPTDKKGCVTCRRNFSSLTEESSYKTRITKNISILQGQINDHEQDIKTLQKAVDNIRRVSPLWEVTQRLASEIQELEKGIIILKAKREALLEDIDKANVGISKINVELSELKQMVKKAQEIDSILKAIEQLNQVIEDEESKEDLKGVKSAEEIQLELEKLNNQKTELLAEVNKLSKELELHKQSMLQVEKLIKELSARKETLSIEFESQIRTEKEVEELEKEKRRLTASKQEKQKEIQELSPELTRINAELEAFKHDYSTQEKAMLTEYQHFNEVKSRYTAINDELEKILAANVTLELHKMEILINENKLKIEECNEKIMVYEEELSNLQGQLKQLEEFERNIKNNLRFRELERRIESLNARAAEIEAILQSVNPTQLNKEGQRTQHDHECLLKEKAGLLGEVKQLQDQLARWDHELETDYRDIEERYRVEMIDYKTSTIALEDLEKYGKALDMAIMKYHSLKMFEINKCIRDLWIETYQGSDIDTIEIRTDTESTRGNRSYNYRVVMIRGGVELDMRGRCSAGQKVLTSLIIRLALAETFGINCGILALDEPTTNLDHDNIASLARSLNRIIDIRRKQSNFQLIVITHDESFMRLLGKSEFAEYYWRISKDPFGHSHIEKKAIAANYALDAK